MDDRHHTAGRRRGHPDDDRRRQRPRHRGADPGVTVAGKTGTAQNTPGQAPHAWFVAFAPAQAPKYAVAVLVEHGGSQGSDATGGAVAAPIAARMLRTALGLP